MSESHFRSFEETGLPPFCQKAYLLARDAHQIRLPHSAWTVAPYVYHPVALAEAALRAKLSMAAVKAALVHDLQDWTPVHFDALYAALDAEVHDLVYDMTCPMPVTEGSASEWIAAYTTHLLKGSEEAQLLKVMDMTQTVLALGANQAQACVDYVQLHRPVLDALLQAHAGHSAWNGTALRADCAFKWGERRAYEEHIANFKNTSEVMA